MCGIFALCSSTKSQLPNILPPTPAELSKLLKSRQIKGRIQETGLKEDFSRNLTVDQLAAIIEKFGRRRGLNLQLGVCWEGREPLIIRSEHTTDVQTIWIHNNNVSVGGGYSHYSGMLCGPEALPRQKDNNEVSNINNSLVISSHSCRERMCSLQRSNILWCPAMMKAIK